MSGKSVGGGDDEFEDEVFDDAEVEEEVVGNQSQNEEGKQKMEQSGRAKRGRITELDDAEETVIEDHVAAIRDANTPREQKSPEGGSRTSEVIDDDCKVAVDIEISHSIKALGEGSTRVFEEEGLAVQADSKHDGVRSTKVSARKESAAEVPDEIPEVRSSKSRSHIVDSPPQKSAEKKPIMTVETAEDFDDYDNESFEVETPSKERRRISEFKNEKSKRMEDDEVGEINAPKEAPGKIDVSLRSENSAMRKAVTDSGGKPEVKVDEEVGVDVSDTNNSGDPATLSPMMTSSNNRSGSEKRIHKTPKPPASSEMKRTPSNRSRAVSESVDGVSVSEGKQNVFPIDIDKATSLPDSLKFSLRSPNPGRAPRLHKSIVKVKEIRKLRKITHETGESVKTLHSKLGISVSQNDVGPSKPVRKSRYAHLLAKNNPAILNPPVLKERTLKRRQQAYTKPVAKAPNAGRGGAASKRGGFFLTGDDSEENSPAASRNASREQPRSLSRRSTPPSTMRSKRVPVPQSSTRLRARGEDTENSDATGEGGGRNKQLLMRLKGSNKARQRENAAREQIRKETRDQVEREREREDGQRERGSGDDDVDREGRRDSDFIEEAYMSIRDKKVVPSYKGKIPVARRTYASSRRDPPVESVKKLSDRFGPNGVDAAGRNRSRVGAPAAAGRAKEKRVAPQTNRHIKPGVKDDILDSFADMDVDDFIDIAAGDAKPIPSKRVSKMNGSRSPKRLRARSGDENDSNASLEIVGEVGSKAAGGKRKPVLMSGSEGDDGVEDTLYHKRSSSNNNIEEDSKQSATITSKSHEGSRRNSSVLPRVGSGKRDQVGGASKVSKQAGGRVAPDRRHSSDGGIDEVKHEDVKLPIVSKDNKFSIRNLHNDDLSVEEKEVIQSVEKELSTGSSSPSKYSGFGGKGPHFKDRWSSRDMTQDPRERRLKRGTNAHASTYQLTKSKGPSGFNANTYDSKERIDYNRDTYMAKNVQKRMNEIKETQSVRESVEERRRQQRDRDEAEKGKKREAARKRREEQRAWSDAKRQVAVANSAEELAEVQERLGKIIDKGRALMAEKRSKRSS